jgi:mRNA-degrading endonuclease YafQ of YafQ-DinJ toxin-antitoxin module
MAEVRFTPPFKRRLKTLTKRYRQIQIDIQPIIDQLQAGNFIGIKFLG